MEILIGLLILYLTIGSILNWNIQNKKISFCLNLLLLSIITGSFYEKIGGGGDYDNYRNIFNSISLLNHLLIILVSHFYVLCLSLIFLYYHLFISILKI